MNFGPYDPEGEAEAELYVLWMKDNQKINKYLVEFNRITARLQWGNATLRHPSYRGLPSRVKDAISRSGKSATLTGLRQQAATIDHRYWERKAEINRKSHLQPQRQDRPTPPHNSASSS